MKEISFMLSGVIGIGVGWYLRKFSMWLHGKLYK